MWTLEWVHQGLVLGSPSCNLQALAFVFLGGSLRWCRKDWCSKLILWVHWNLPNLCKSPMPSRLETTSIPLLPYNKRQWEPWEVVQCCQGQRICRPWEAIEKNIHIWISITPWNFDAMQWIWSSQDRLLWLWLK